MRVYCTLLHCVGRCFAVRYAVSVYLALCEAFVLLAVFLYYWGRKMALKRAERAHKANTIYSG
jgi:hypothetical protein